MGLNDIATEVMERLAAGFPTLRWEVSTRGLPRNDSPPRVIWVPATDTFSAPRKTGNNPRHLFTCNAAVRLHVWGESVGQVEEIREALLASLHLSAVGSMSLGPGAWESTLAQLDLGELYVLTVTFQVPQREALAPTVPITAAVPDNDSTVAGDGHLDHGEQ